MFHKAMPRDQAGQQETAYALDLLAKHGLIDPAPSPVSEPIKLNFQCVCGGTDSNHADNCYYHYADG
jgi:hypothetical protein